MKMYGVRIYLTKSNKLYSESYFTSEAAREAYLLDFKGTHKRYYYYFELAECGVTNE